MTTHESNGSVSKFGVTEYPFQLSDALVARLPVRDGNEPLHIDVKVGPSWEGVLVVDGDGRCIGIYIARRVVEYPLPFAASDIEDVRPACLWNRLLSSLPDLWDSSLVTIFVVSPTLLLLAALLPVPLPLSLVLLAVSVLGCAIAIHLMYQAHGFPFLRPFAAMFGLAQILAVVYVVLSALLR